MKKEIKIIIIMLVIIICIISSILILLNIQNKDGIDKNGIERDNEIDTSKENEDWRLESISEDKSLQTLRIMYQCLEDGIYISDIYIINNYDAKNYFVCGVKSNEYVYYNVYLDYNNYTFDVNNISKEEYENIENGKVEEKYTVERKITKNEENTFSFEYMSDDVVAQLYYDIVKNLLMNNYNQMYNLLDNSYKEARFNNVQNYYEYCNKMHNKIQDSMLIKYSKKVENNIETYTCIDNLNNTFIIKINSTFEPEIQLDDYTIETDYFKTQYAQASNESKAVTDADKFMKMINSKDYETAYNLLDATYKANTFPTLSSYIQSMEASFYENNFYEMKDISEQGSYYIVTIEIKDRVSASANNKTIKVIIGLKEGTNFAMSFAN